MLVAALTQWEANFIKHLQEDFSPKLEVSLFSDTCQEKCLHILYPRLHHHFWGLCLIFSFHMF